MVDGLNRQRETAKVIVSEKGYYLLSVKENHPSLMRDIRDYARKTPCEAACLREPFGSKATTKSKRGWLLSRRILVRCFLKIDFYVKNDAGYLLLEHQVIK